MLDIDRWRRDPSRPDGREAWRDLALRVVLPAAVLWVVVVGVGLLLTGPLTDLGTREASINVWFVEHRTATLNTLTSLWTAFGNSRAVIGICAVAVVVVWWRTKQWWYAAVLAIAVATEAVVFLLVTMVVGRDRPDVPKLDAAPPTSSYPSGHAGASTALYVTLALMSQRIRLTWLRVTVTVVLLALPLLVAYSRVYRGMHHLSDVIVGVLNGLTCVVLGWYWLRRSPADAAVSGDDASVAVEEGTR